MEHSHLTAGLSGLIDIAFVPPASPLIASSEAFSGAPGFQAIAVGEHGATIFYNLIVLIYSSVIIYSIIYNGLSSINLTLSALTAGESYTIQKTDSLREISWETVANGVIGTGGPFTVSLALAAAVPQIFYRALSSTNAPAQ